MIVAAYGLAGMTPLELQAVLEETGVSYGFVSPSGLHKVKKAKPVVTPVVFSSMNVFLKTRSKFTQKVVALIVDNPWTLVNEYGLETQGLEIVKDRVVFTTYGAAELSMALSTVQHLDQELVVERKSVYDPVPKILTKYNASRLSVLQTALYRVKDLEVRKAVNAVILNWIVGPKRLDHLEGLLYKVGGEKVARTFIGVLSTEDMKTLKLAAMEAKKNPTKLGTIARKHGLNAFDLRYLTAVRN